MSVTIKDVQAAHARIKSGVYLTPCPESIPLSELCGCHVFCKLEYLQRTGSFKERGARNALLLLTNEQRTHGVIAASAGNHALGLAYHGSLLGIPVTVVMPRFAPLTKVATCRRLGAHVILHGEDFVQARLRADELADHQKLTYVHGFDDPAIIAGQGTMGIEVLDQVQDAEAVVVPIGGGGLIAGISLAIKSARPDVQVIGVEVENSAGFTAALRHGQPRAIQSQPTLADGLAVGKIGDLAFSIARQNVDEVVTVDESSLVLAIFRLIELEKSVVEGAGAAPLAACLSAKLPGLAGKRVVLVLTGGNIDLTILDRVIEYGLVSDGRLCRFAAIISDRPGGLAILASLVASTGASIKDIAHDRTFSGPDVTTVRAVCVVETTDHQHAEHLLQVIREAGIEVIPETCNVPR